MSKPTAQRLFKRFRILIFIVALSVVFLIASGATYASAPALDFFNCTPASVATFTNRVHVRCSPAAPGGISYFAACTTTDSASASRFLSVFTTAKVTAKNLGIYYTASDTSGTACGCASSDCRLLTGAEVLP